VQGEIQLGQLFSADELVEALYRGLADNPSAG
jgi:hypothetical protein